MPNYHISLKTGRPNICRAETRPCPIGGEHFSSKEKAQEAQEAKLKKENKTFSSLKKNSDAKTEILNRLTEQDKAVAISYGKNYEKEGEEAVAAVTRGVRSNLAALRTLEADLGGKIVVTNGGAYQRFQANNTQWTMQLQTNSSGETFVSIFNAGVPVYGDHSRDKSWSFKPRNTIVSHTATVEKLYKDFISAPENQASEPMWG